MEQIFTYFSFSFVFTQNNLLIIDAPILIQSIHTRKIERFVFRFTCPRETFSNLIFSNLIFLIKIIFRKALERKKKGEENVYRVKSRKKTFIFYCFSQRKLLPDWMEQWQVGERQQSLAPYHKLYRKSRFRFSRTPSVAPLNIHRKGLQTTCCAPVTKREARIRVR